MWPDKIEKEHKHGDKIVRRTERAKALLGLVPRLELLVKGLNEVVGNIIMERLDADVCCTKRLHWLSVSTVAIGNDGGRPAG